MSPSLKRVIICSSVVFICICVECGDFQSQPNKSHLSEVSRLDKPRFPDTNIESSSESFNSNQTNVYLEGNVKTSSNISLTKPLNNGQGVPKTTTVRKELTEFAMEGGGIGIPLQNSSLQSQDDKVFDEVFHIKGSKGRKGVNFPGSSVVPRMEVAVDQLVHLTSNNTTTIETPAALRNSSPLVNSLSSNNNTKTTMDSKPPLSNDFKLINKTQEKIEMQEKPSGVFNTSHSKKPEYVSDEKDDYDFDKYSIIQTSTTGEDYVIIGIVIVIGIWFSVFGALIFYRRAGEYWDRRHYRRMDFLVEGMYND